MEEPECETFQALAVTVGHGLEQNMFCAPELASGTAASRREWHVKQIYLILWSSQALLPLWEPLSEPSPLSHQTQNLLARHVVMAPTYGGEHEPGQWWD